MIRELGDSKEWQLVQGMAGQTVQAMAARLAKLFKAWLSSCVKHGCQRHGWRLCPSHS